MTGQPVSNLVCDLRGRESTTCTWLLNQNHEHTIPLSQHNVEKLGSRRWKRREEFQRAVVTYHNMTPVIYINTFVEFVSKELDGT